METMETMELTPDLFEPLDSAEKNSEFIAAEPRTYLSDAWHRFRKNKLALCGLVFLVIMVILAIVVPMVSPYTYDGMDYSSVNLLPCLEHPMGTDKFGRDILVRVMYGARISLMIGFSSALICLVIGVVYGGFSGYIGGKTDMILMRIVDILYAIPNLLLVILIMLVFGSNVTSIMIGICLTSWIGMARMVRAQVMSLKEGIDDPGRDIPPYGEAQIDRVIVCHVVTEHLHFRPAGRITHLNGAAGRLILPVQILLRVSNLGGYFKQIRANCFSKMLSHFGSMTTRGEVRNKFPTHAHAPRHTV